jgi:hypothetical protein
MRRVERLIGPLQVSRELLKVIACRGSWLTKHYPLERPCTQGLIMLADVSRKTYLRYDRRPSGFSSGAFQAFVNRLRLPK